MSDRRTYKVFPIPVPVSEEDIVQYSHLRLLGLKTNPEAFGSTYEGESTNTLEQWRGRIDIKERFTIIACLVSTEEGKSRDEWIGTASILTPEMAMVDGGAHFLVGMWVHPEHRKQGW